jgi:hypothetical protein
MWGFDFLLRQGIQGKHGEQWNSWTEIGTAYSVS